MFSQRGLLSVAFFWLLSVEPPLVASQEGQVTAPPSSGNTLWYRSPATQWSKEYLPVGNGYLGVMIPGGTTIDDTILNIESLWSGGPFADPAYNGGNKPASQQTFLAEKLAEIRQTIFDDPNGLIANVSVLTQDAGAYGSFSAAAHLVTTHLNASTFVVSEYKRWLDLDTAIARSVWKEGDIIWTREYFCSHPAKLCASRSTATGGGEKIALQYHFTGISGLPEPTLTCLDSSTAQLRNTAGANGQGMTYEILARAVGQNVSCTNGVLTVSGGAEAVVYWTGGTNYDINAGDEAHGFSFRGADPHDALLALLPSSSSKSDYTTLRAGHTRDYIATATGRFALSLGQTADLAHSTDELVSAYTRENGNPYLEWILFNYGRYLLWSSGRGVVPANLQGVWSRDSGAPWSGDYHANINVQQNYWSAEMTDLDVTQSLWDLMSKTWAPRGAQTARTLYNTTRGWVTHNEMNIFGHTGMKAYEPYNTAEWANYPASAAWMMVHVWDHLDYGRGDLAWWRAQGYPLIKSVASFWLDNLFEDAHFKDGTLVVNPCNSPEQAPTTFGCAHWQQVIWELFNSVEKGYSLAGDRDPQFLQEIRNTRSKLDRGLHIGKWGQLQEWKVDLDSPTDLHRHLSHLHGLYPGYAIASYAQTQPVPNLSYADLIAATRTSLEHRGDGTGPDGDAGWEKVWRAACWAQLGEAERFYDQLKYALKRNFGPNLWSLYNPFNEDPIFQFDANGAWPGAVLNAIVQAPDVASFSDTLIITLLPALPAAWSATGSIRGARLRGGIGLDLSWKNGRPSAATFTFDRARASRKVQVAVAGEVVATFVARPGETRKMSF